MKRFTPKTNERGISLVEALIVLSIFAILVAAIWATASTAFNNQKKRQVSEETIQIVNNIKGLFQGQQAASAAGFTEVQGIAAGVFPSEMVVDKATADIRHPYATVAKSVTVTGASGQITLNMGLAATGQGLPQDACVELISRLAGTQESASRIGLISIGTATKAYVAATTGDFPVTPTKAVTSCDKTTSTNGLIIVFAVP